MNPDGATALLAAILTGTPSLPQAACRRRAPLFDDRHDGESAEQQRQRLDAARGVCQGCRAQTACRSTLRDSRYGGVGVQAGQVLVKSINNKASKKDNLSAEIPSPRTIMADCE